MYNIISLSNFHYSHSPKDYNEKKHYILVIIIDKLLDKYLINKYLYLLLYIFINYNV